MSQSKRFVCADCRAQFETVGEKDVYGFLVALCPDCRAEVRRPYPVVVGVFVWVMAAVLVLGPIDDLPEFRWRSWAAAFLMLGVVAVDLRMRLRTLWVR